jgi:uncharacterized protein DUF6885
VASVNVVAVEEQQKDNLCGPFWATRILRDAGIEQWAGEPVDEDLIALRAGSTLPDAPPETSLPRGATSKTDYRYELPVVGAADAGTAAGALAGAIEAAAGGALCCVPVRGAWTDRRVEGLVDQGRRLGARLIANVRTGRLWGSRPPRDALLAELDGRVAPDAAPDWDVGHFCELSLLLRGPGGALVLVRDSYPMLGWGGQHLQPPRAVAAALLRDDGREGGVLAVVAADAAERVEGLARELGLEVGIWDNGTRR